MIAIISNTPGLWLKRFYRAIYIIPVAIPPIIVATVWQNMFDPTHGAINFLSTIIFRLPPGGVQSTG